MGDSKDFCIALRKGTIGVWDFMEMPRCELLWISLTWILCSCPRILGSLQNFYSENVFSEARQ